MKGLEHCPKSGLLPVADETYLREVEETIEQDPGELGYDFILWMIQRLNQYISQVTGVRISDECVRLTLHTHGWVYRRPKEDLGALQDFVKINNADFPILLKTPVFSWWIIHLDTT